MAPTEQVPQAALARAVVLWLGNFWLDGRGLDYFSPAPDTLIHQHAWSLAVEEQFYLIWPLVVAAVIGPARSASSTRRSWVVGGLILAGLGICLWQTDVAPVAAFYLLHTRFWQFALGAALALSIEPRWRTHHARATGLLGAPGIVLLLGAALLFDGTEPYPGWRALLPSIGTAALIVAGMGRGGRAWRLVLESRPLQWLGARSYAWYLWHWPVLLLFRSMFPASGPEGSVFCALFSLLMAHASFVWFEQPVRHATLVRSRPRLTLAAAGVAMAGMVWLAMVWGNAAREWELEPAQRPFMRATVDLPLLYRKGCDDFSREFTEPCTFGSENADKTMVVIGDSIGMHWSPALESLVASDWRIVLMTKSARPPLELARYAPGVVSDQCERWQRDALTHARALRPDVILAGWSPEYRLTPMQWRESAAALVREFSSRVSAVGVIAPSPTWHMDPLSCAARNAWRKPLLELDRPCAQEGSAAPVPNDYIDVAIEGVENAFVLDLNDLACPDGVCVAESGGLIVYRDRAHLTATFVESLSGPVRERLELALERIDYAGKR